MATFSKVAVELLLKDGLSGGLRRVRDGLQQLGDEGKRALSLLNDASEDFSRGMDKIGKGLEIKRALVDPIVAAAGSLQDAQKQLAVNLPRGLSAEQLAASVGRATAQATTTAGPTPFSAEQILGLQTEFIKGGMDLEAAFEAADAAARLATAERTDLADAQATMGTLMAQFGLAASQAGEGAELLMRGAAATRADVGYLREAAAGVTSARSAGLDPKETLALLSGGAGLMAGSEMGNAAQGLLSAAATLKDKKLRGDLFNEQGQFAGWQNLQKALQERTAGMTDQQRSGYFAKQFGQGPAADLAQLLASGAIDVRGNLAAMDEQLTLGEKVAAMSDTLSAKTEALGGSFDTLKATIGTPLLAPLEGLADQANTLVSRLTGALQESPESADALAKGVAGAAAATAAIGVAQVLRGGVQGGRGIGALMKQGLLGKAAQAQELATGVATGRALEAAGVQSVYVVNAAEIGKAAGGGVGLPIPDAGLPGAGAGAGASKLGQALKGAGIVGLAAAASGAAGSKLADYSAQLYNAPDAGVMQRYIAAGLAGIVRLSPQRLTASDEAVQTAADVQNAAVNAVLKALKIDVRVGDDRTAVDARWADGSQVARSAARSGV